MAKKRNALPRSGSRPRVNPQKAAALANEAIEFCRSGDYKNGIRLFRKAEERDGKNHQIMLNLAIAYHATGDFKDAKKYYTKAIRLRSEYIVKILQNGINEMAMNKLDSAQCCIEAVYETDPENITVQLASGSLKLRRGEKEEGAALLRKCYASDPKMTSAIVELAEFSLLNEEDIKKTRDNITLGAGVRKNDKFLQLALGKGYQQSGDYAKAYEMYVAANKQFAQETQLTNQQAVNDLQGHFEQVKSIISPELISRLSAGASQESKLIFIVGLPKSGLHDVAYLLQQSGEAVIAGELNWCNQKIYQMLQANDNNFRNTVESITETTISALADDYSKLLAGLRRSGKYVINCQASNFVNVWFIKLIFPQAKIICAQRNPQDQALEIFFNHIPGMEYLNDLHDIASYCQTAQDIIEYWYELLGNDLIRFDYDAFIADPEAEYSRLMQDLGIAEYEKIDFDMVSKPSLNVREVYRPETPLHEQFREYTGDISPKPTVTADSFSLNFDNFNTAGNSDASAGGADNSAKEDPRNQDDSQEGFRLHF